MSISYQSNTQNTQASTTDSIDTQVSAHEIFNIGCSDFILIDEVNETHHNKSYRQIAHCLVDKTRSSFTCKNITKRLPILQWLPHYTTEHCVGDLLAGITVGLTMIPQSMAFSALAGLPPQQGLYSSFLGSLLYVFFGTCKEVSMGPTGIVSLIAYNTLNGLGPVYGTLLCFITGIIQLIMSVVGLGFLIDFISGPVNSGFTSAVSILIVASQMTDMIGVSSAGSTLLEMTVSMYNDRHNFRPGDALLGLICIVVILLMRRMALCQFVPKDENGKSTFRICLNRTTWLIGTFRNAIVLIVSSYISYLYIRSTGHDVSSNSTPPIPFKVIGNIPGGLPSFDFPQFSVTKNGTRTDFFEMVSNMGSGVIVLPLIALLESISICKTFAEDKTVDATQELLANGLCNIGSSFFHSFPGAGSFSRSAVNGASGVRSLLGGLYAGILVIVSLLFCTPYFYYIPKSALAAIIISAVVFMVEVRVVRPIYRSKKIDLVPGVTTFIACLFLPLEIGVLIGIGLNLVSILYHAARPKLLIEIHKTRDGESYMMVTPDRCLIFPSVEYVRNLVMKHSSNRELPVVIDCSHIYGADFTAAKVIEVLTQDFSRRGQALFFYNLKPSVVAVFEGVQPRDFITFYHRHDLDHLLQKWKRQQIENTPIEPISL